MLWADKLTKGTRYYAWKSLIESKFSYAIGLLSKHSPKISNTFETLQYRAIKGLLGIRKMVFKESLLEIVLGTDPTNLLLWQS